MVCLVEEAHIAQCYRRRRFCASTLSNLRVIIRSPPLSPLGRPAPRHSHPSSSPPRLSRSPHLPASTALHRANVRSSLRGVFDRNRFYKIYKTDLIQKHLRIRCRYGRFRFDPPGHRQDQRASEDTDARGNQKVDRGRAQEGGEWRPGGTKPDGAFRGEEWPPDFSYTREVHIYPGPTSTIAGVCHAHAHRPPSSLNQMSAHALTSSISYHPPHHAPRPRPTLSPLLTGNRFPPQNPRASYAAWARSPRFATYGPQSCRTPSIGSERRRSKGTWRPCKVLHLHPQEFRGRDPT